MKLSILSTVALSLTAAAVPHGHRHPHKHANRRDVVVDVVTQVATQTAAAAVVGVNQDGAPQWTSWRHHRGHGHGQHKPTTAPTSPAAPTSYATGSTEAPASSQPSGYSQPATSSSSPQQSSSAASAPAPSGSAPSSGGGSGSGSWGYGLSYSPYDSNGDCKTQDQVNSDFNAFSGYGMVRIYGTDCDQVSTVLQAAKSKNMKVFAGVYDITQVESEIQTIVAAAKNDWDAIDTISIGNEVVNSGGSASSVVSAISTARGLLKTAGYTGKVVTVDTFVAIIDNPELCQASDYAAANCHAFFDSDISADQAGTYVSQQAANVKKACGGMDTVITESGWPSGGDANGAAVPSPENQKAAISSLRSAFSDNIVLFSAFNDDWKQNFDGSFDAEHYWGIYGNAPA